jgi:micrococcal nuclease
MATNQPPHQVFCQNCRGGNPPDALRCMWCGHPLPTQAARVPQPPPPSAQTIPPSPPRQPFGPQANVTARRKRPLWQWAVLGLLGLCLCSGIATSLSTRTQPKSQDQQATLFGTPLVVTTAEVPAGPSPTGEIVPQLLPTPTPEVAPTEAPAPPPPTAPTDTAVPPPPAATDTPAGPQLTEAVVRSVVDGDTLNVVIGGKQYPVRIIGVDTPETKDPRTPVMCFGKEATAETQRLVDLAGGKVLLEKDVSETDKYDRLLRYVWLEHPDGRRMLNLELVKGGFAQASSYPPDVRYQDQFTKAMRQAKEANVGLWGACGAFGVPVATPTAVPVVREPQPPAVQPPSGGGAGGLRYDPFGPDRDCGDFATYQEAYAFYKAAGGPGSDRHRLDQDKDGIPCESLPGAP